MHVSLFVLDAKTMDVREIIRRPTKAECEQDLTARYDVENDETIFPTYHPCAPVREAMSQESFEKLKKLT